MKGNLLTWLKERASELNLVRSPLSHLMEADTLGTTTLPGTTKSFFRVLSSSIRPDPDGPGLHPDSRISDVRSYPNPITETAFSAATWGSIRTWLFGLYAIDARNRDYSEFGKVFAEVFLENLELEEIMVAVDCFIPSYFWNEWSVEQSMTEITLFLGHRRG